MTDIETLVAELHEIREILDGHLEQQNNLLLALVAATQRSAVASETIALLHVNYENYR